MERLEKLVNILKLTPHKQPELVKEAAHRALTRSLRNDPQIEYLLKPLIEILIQYCDSEEGAQRSLFNDYLNSVILAYQNQFYLLILHVLLEEVANNGTARSTTAALLRIPHLIHIVCPIELGCEPQKLVKALIEIARRSDDVRLQKALEFTLKDVMPYLDPTLRTNKESQFLMNSLIEILLRNLQLPNDETQIKRIAASCISNICSVCESQLQNTLAKLKLQLDEFLLIPSGTLSALDANKFVGFCLCIKEIPQFSRNYQDLIVTLLVSVIKSELNDLATILNALETLRTQVVLSPVKEEIIRDSAKAVINRFLICEQEDGVASIRKDASVMLQSNALAYISVIIKKQSSVVEPIDKLFLFKDHQGIAVRNQVVHIIGNYIEATWRFPQCVDRSLDCERIRKLWVELRSILFDDSSHPDTLKSCVSSIKTCVNTLIESDHCLHIIEYQDFERLIQLYQRTNSKPLKVETLSLFLTLNYRTLHYLERHHWSKLRSQSTRSPTGSLQDHIVNEILIKSLTDDHQMIRMAASSTLIAIIPHLYVTELCNRSRALIMRSNDPIVSLACDLASEHMVVLDQAQEYTGPSTCTEESMMSSENHERFIVRDQSQVLSASIVPSYGDHCTKQGRTETLSAKSPSSLHSTNTPINLMHVVRLLKEALENSLDQGKVAISSIVRTLSELSSVYPIFRYPSSWDCRPSEYCDCFTLLNFLLTYLENLTEPDVVVEDLESYRIFLRFSQQLLFALCHEAVSSDYEHQRMKPYHKRLANFNDGDWSDLTIKPSCIDEILQIYFTHLTKLLWLISYVIEEKTNPFSNSTKSNLSLNQQKVQPPPESAVNHETLTSNGLLFGRLHRKLEMSYKSSKKNLNQQDEKFWQILETCLSNISSLLEFIGMNKSIEQVKVILSYLRTTSSLSCAASLRCARQLLKSLFGVNILALYQVDPQDWFEEDSNSSCHEQPISLGTLHDSSSVALHGVYHYLVSNPYKVFSSYHSMNCSQITPFSDKALASLNLESRRALKVRRRIEDRVKSLFESHPNRIVSPKIRYISEALKNTIAEFTPMVTDSMSQFNSRGFVAYQSETLLFMSYLLLLRVNFQKLPLATDLISSINKILDKCGEKVFLARENGIQVFLTNCFTFLTLLTYDRGPSKPMFQMAAIIQKLDDIRAKLSMVSATERDLTVYVVPLLRCMVEDLFIFRTDYFQNSIAHSKIEPTVVEGDLVSLEPINQSKKNDAFDALEAERETIAQKLLDVIDNPGVYDLLSILILESRRNSSEIKYKKLSQHLLSIIPGMLSKRCINLSTYKQIEHTRRIIENISPEVFHPVNFIFETLLETPRPAIFRGYSTGTNSQQEFQRWMSLVIVAIHILTTQVKEEKFLSRIRETMAEETFVGYLLHIAQLCTAEILIQLAAPYPSDESVVFLAQQLSSYILYLTHMFQSGLFFQLSRSAANLIQRQVRENRKIPLSFAELCVWARNSDNFSLNTCETMFFHMKLIYPDLTMIWCNIMMLLNNVDCNREFWRNLLVYDCHHCSASQAVEKSLSALDMKDEDATVDDESLPPSDSGKNFKRGRAHINRPSSLNLSDISFNDQLRRSFIKKIAASESRDKAFNRNIIETSGEDGKLLEREVNIGNIEQCLAPNIELTRRGALCLVLDFVSISMNDVEHITWLIIHHIIDIIRWSHEMPIAEFINAVHGNSASSGIFIQAINTNFNNFTTISFVERLLWTLEQVHYTQYGPLVVLLVEKLLSSPQLMLYQKLTMKIENFACETVQKLLNDTNKSLVTTNDEVINQLTTEDLNRIISMLDGYPKLTKLLTELYESSYEKTDTPIIEFPKPIDDTDSDSDQDDLEVLRSKANLIYWIAEQGSTSNICTLIPALKTIRTLLSEATVLERVSKDQVVACSLVASLYSLALNVLPPPTRLVRPKFWSNSEDEKKEPSKEFNFNEDLNYISKPTMALESKRPTLKSTLGSKQALSGEAKTITVEDIRLACLQSLFLFDNADQLVVSQFQFIDELIVCIARIPLINSFVLTPSALWRQNIWPTKFEESDEHKIKIPMVPHEILSRDFTLLEKFCDRLLRLGWITRRQFEEAWMTLLGVLSTTLMQAEQKDDQLSLTVQEEERKTNLLASCKVINTLTRFLLLARKSTMGNPLSDDVYYSPQSFDSRLIELTKSISANLSSLAKKTRPIFEQLDSNGRRSSSRSSNVSNNALLSASSQDGDTNSTSFCNYLMIPAQKLRMTLILNVDLDMQETVVIEASSKNDSTKPEEVDIESCIRLILSIYKQKLRDPNEISCTVSDDQSPEKKTRIRQFNAKNRAHQLAPPLTSTICQSILALSDLFTEYEQFDWMFETFVQVFKQAERNLDEIQMQHLIVGLCKAAAVCCYQIPTELPSMAATNHRDIMFEKCRQSIEKCLKSEFGPLRKKTLDGVYYMLEDSINIVASGAWELDDFKRLRQSRLTWILRLMPIILDGEFSKLLTKRQQVMTLFKTLCETVSETELKAIKI